ncbi:MULTISPECIES: carboxymuconolactone decarboxylase family protein [Micromonospora]|uniref:Carboxymuconolactone decarboxylase family protein n=2 Tax=Micromonospora TaxID=1873 RepID=A0ABX9Y316_MICCH|nr:MULTISPECIES: carboxymuconolactone decarboxylase family protein [Micromonospora]EWM66554.1 alkylhydroperoxidase like protein, AhpD family [Micromonospora sp. M42]MBC8990236.1 carboxymuconolactone decarboxylase family protein [Micromonospora chalcea]MBP1780266.1 AhpD family alkylhydroperoxidase [Micromonospora sp. HB375]MBQ1064792.1 carboxymuconolactone decarboxylase family protein [Micromonospora sp. C41]MCK1808353.1 carboxymuconolactone decarboxylase family protein [Micromonospora sp. R421
MQTRFNLFENPVSAAFMKRFAGAGLAIHQSTLPRTVQELVSLRASQINGCGWCIDMHTKEAVAGGESAVRLNLVAAWRESTVFTEAERAALAFAEEGTRLADAHQGVSDETWARVREHYDDDQIAALVCLLGLINAANRFAVLVHQRGGSYEPGMFAAAMS